MVQEILVTSVLTSLAFLLGRQLMAFSKNKRIREVELLAGHYKRTAGESQRALQDLEVRANTAEETVETLRRSIVELPEIAQRLSATQDLRQIPECTLDLVQEIFRAAYSVFYRRARDELVAVACRGETEFGVGHRIAAGEGIVGWTALKQVAVTPEDLRFESGLARGRDFGKGVPEQGFSLCVPVTRNGRTIGVILIGPSERELPQWRELARTIALITSVAMASAAVLKQQKRLANTDGPTGLLNRTHILQCVREMIDSRRDGPRTLCLFLFDIDHFKHYNDSNGHLPGDELLKSLAKLLRDSIREAELAGRYGGEEFLVVMPNVTRVEALRAAERIRVLVSERPFDFREGQPGGSVTVSGGVAMWPTDGDDVETLLRCADEALYEAKRAGRNRVFAYSTPELAVGDPGDLLSGGMEPDPVDEDK